MNIKKIIRDALSFLGLINNEIGAHIPVVVQLLGKLKTIVDNPEIDAIAAIFIGVPQEIAIKEALDHVLIIATQGLAIAEDVRNAKSASEKLLIFAKDLQKYHVTMRHMNIGKLAALVIKYLSKDGMNVNEATLAVEAVIKGLKTNQ